jgi:predicted transcriptional regulator
MRLAELIWEHGPVASMELVGLAGRALGWKKSTTFSVLKALINKGAAQNARSVVTMLRTRRQFVTGQSQNYVEDMFGGSLPGFVAAFFGDGRPSAQQIEELRRLMDDFERRGENG